MNSREVRLIVFGSIEIFLGVVIAIYAMWDINSKSYIISEYGQLTYNLFSNPSWGLMVASLFAVIQGLSNIINR